MWSKAAAVAGWLGAAALTASAAQAVEINVIASTAMREVLEELVPMFERASGHKVALSFQSGSVLPVKVKEGAQADLVVTTPATVDDLLAAKSVGYSQGPSGVHFMSVLARLGIVDQIKAKGAVPPLGTRVGTLIAK